MILKCSWELGGLMCTFLLDQMAVLVLRNFVRPNGSTGPR